VIVGKTELTVKSSIKETGQAFNFKPSLSFLPASLMDEFQNIKYVLKVPGVTVEKPGYTLILI